MREYSEELGLSGIKEGPSVYWPPIPSWLWIGAVMDLSIEELIPKGEKVNLAAYVEEHLSSTWGD